MNEFRRNINTIKSKDMLPGPNLIYKCPNCDNLLKNQSLLSGNTFDGAIYSDGKRIFPMMPEFPDLTKCKKCNHIFWLSKTREIGSYSWGDEQNLLWQNADNAVFLTIDEYFLALSLSLVQDRSEEFYIRQRIWWAFNDRVRNGNDLYNSEEEKTKWESNVAAFIKILDPDDVSQLIMIAELNRNLGNFEICLTLIESLTIPDLDWLKEAFIKNCSVLNQLVFQLN
jgi:hypothetical protein